MAKKVILKDLDNVEILPITRGELIVDSSGKEAFHSNEFLATNSLPGLMSPEEKTKLSNIERNTIDSTLSTTSTNPVQNKVVTVAINEAKQLANDALETANEASENISKVQQIINSIKANYLKSATVNGNVLTIVDLSDSEITFTNTIYNTFLKETAANTGGRNGLVPKPNYNDGSKTRFLREDGTWVIPTNTSYTFANGTDGSFTVTPSGGSGQKVTIGKPATAGTADKVAKSLTLKIKTGTTEGTDLYTYDGSLAKTLDIKAGANITLTPTAGVLTISATNSNTTYTLSGALDGNTFVTTLTPSSGTATTAIVPVMVGATSSAAGKAGLVPAPATNKHTSFLRGDGTWVIPSDTHWTTHLYVGAKDTASNALTTNGNTYIKVADNSAIRDQYIIKGAGRTTVASDTSGNITITSPTVTWSEISEKPSSFTPSIHNHPTSQINALTDYTKATTAAALATTDSLNTALGKLEYKAHYAYDWIIGVTATDTDEYINKWGEIVGFLDSVKEGTDIIDEFVTRKTTLTISGKKTFSNGLAITGGSTENITMSFFLGIDSFSNGGTVRWITANKVASAIGALTQHQSLANYVTLNTAQTITGAKTFVNDFTLSAGNEDRYITFNYTGGTGYDWRIGYLGSGSDDANYFVILSDKTDGTYVNALRIGLTSLESVFGGTVTSSGFVKSYSSNSYVLLGGGGHKALTDFATAKHTHNLGNKPASDLSSTYPSGISVGGIYNNGYPFIYGSTITASGNGGYFQIAGQWNSDVSSTSNYDFPTEMYIRGRRDSYDVWTTWSRVLTNRNYTSILDSRYYTEAEADNRFVNITGDTMTGLLTTTSSNHGGIKIGNTYITAINGDLIFQNNSAIRFGGDSWDYNVWAGLKYIHSSKTIYLGLADNSAFTANNAQSDGKLYLPGISNIYTGNGTNLVWHAGNDGSGSGLDADLLDGKHASDFAMVGHTHNYASIGSVVFTPANTELTPLLVLALTGGWSIKKGTWDYAGNGYIVAGSFGNIDLAGTSVLTFGNSSAYTQLYITAPTQSGHSGKTNEIFFYNNHGSDYSPAWTRIITNRNYTNYVNTTNFPGLNKTGTVTSVTVTGANGLSGTGTITTSGTITLSNSGVRSIIINKNYLRVNTNGTNADLTIPYATNANTVDNLHASDFVRAYGTVSIDKSLDSDWGQSMITFDPVCGGTYPESNPNVTLLNLGNNYGRRKQLVFTYSNDNIYYRRRVDSSWKSWVRLALAGESYTKSDADARFVNVTGDTMTGRLNITTSSQTMTLGSANGSWGHIETTAANFYFNKSLYIAGGCVPYENNLYTSGNSTKRWSNIYSVLGNFSGLITATSGVLIGGTADIGWYLYDNRICAGSSTARNVNVGGLLVSNAWADSSKVPTNGIYSKGNVSAAGFVKSSSSDSYVLLGGGSHKALSDFMLKSEILTNNLTTISKSLTVTLNWMDTGITSSNLPANGTYIVLVQVSASDGTGLMYYCYSSGVMSWYKDATNDTEEDEIILHRSGHAYGKTIYLRTVMQSSGVLKLLIGASSNIGKSYTYTFKFKRII